MIMKHLSFQSIVLILFIRFDLVQSQGTYFARIGDNADNHQLSIIGSTQPMHSCNLKNECNYVVKNSENGAMVLKEFIRSTSDYFAVWKKISAVGEYYLLLWKTDSVENFSDMSLKLQ